MQMIEQAERVRRQRRRLSMLAAIARQAGVAAVVEDGAEFVARQDVPDRVGVRRERRRHAAVTAVNEQQRHALAQAFIRQPRAIDISGILPPDISLQQSADLLQPGLEAPAVLDVARRAARQLCGACSGVSVHTTFRRTKDQRVLGNSLSSVMMAPAPTTQPFGIIAPFMMIEPMPISTPSSIVQPCRMTLWPTVQFLPTVSGLLGSVCDRSSFS